MKADVKQLLKNIIRTIEEAVNVSEKELSQAAKELREKASVQEGASDDLNADINRCIALQLEYLELIKMTQGFIESYKQEKQKN